MGATVERVNTDTTSQTVGDSAYIAKWTLLIMGGIILEFIGRFIGYDNNPLGIFFPVVAATTVIASVVIAIFGLYTIWQGSVNKNTMARRTGSMMIIMGLIMLICFFIFKQIIPVIFG